MRARKAVGPPPQLAPAARASDVWLSQRDKGFWCPNAHTGFALLSCLRVYAAATLPISDCDETFNYWEPSHYLMYGTGFQTWEYSPQYALRSYLYVGLHSVLGTVLGSAWGFDKVSTFYFTKLALAVFCAFCETFFYRSVCARFGNVAGAFTLLFLASSAGIFHAATAYLPSTFAMYAVMLCYGFWMRSQAGLAIPSAVVGVVLGWPFAGVVFVPAGLSLLFSSAWLTCILSGLLSLTLVAGASFLVDWAYYGKPVLAVWNIVLYNALGVGGDGKGSELYGVEPWTYYPVNLILNHNLMISLAAGFVALPALWAVQRISSSQRGPVEGSGLSWILSGPQMWKPRLGSCVVAAAVALWLAVMGSQPHKEERFMFPIYPLLAFVAAYVTKEIILAHDQFQLGGKSLPSALSATVMDYIAFGFVGCTALLSLSRVLCIIFSYGAPVEAFVFINSQLARSEVTAAPPVVVRMEPSYRVCVGKEWYRFPSSYFLLDSTPVIIQADPSLPKRRGGPVELSFLKSDFTGHLPQPYLQGKNGSSTVRDGFNDVNMEDVSRYVDLLSCDFVVDVELPEVMVNEELYFNRSSPLSKQFVSIWSKPYLHNPTSPFPYRSLYIPYLSTQRNSYGTYHVLANTARVPQVQRSPETDTEAAPSSQKKKKKRVTTPVESTVKPNPTE